MAEVEAAKKERARVDQGVYHALLFGVAFFYFIVSIVPGQFLKILEVIGFVANRDLGVSYLLKVHDFGGVRSELLVSQNLVYLFRLSPCLLCRRSPLCGSHSVRELPLHSTGTDGRQGAANLCQPHCQRLPPELPVKQPFNSLSFSLHQPIRNQTI